MLISIVQCFRCLGFNVETVTPCRGVSLTVWDVGGQDSLRALWHHYFDHVDGLVFVIDSTDTRRLGTAKAELKGIYQHETMRNVPFVVMANKQDSRDALKAKEIEEKLELAQWSSSRYHIEGCCALTGDGLGESFQILANLINKKKVKQLEH